MISLSRTACALALALAVILLLFEGGAARADDSQTVLLNSGYRMPVIGLGTWTLSNDEAENCVYHALRSGMRLIDTARYYGNESGVGRGLRLAAVGLGAPAAGEGAVVPQASLFDVLCPCCEGAEHQ